MSRTGNKPIVVPEKVKVNFANGIFSAEGPLGKESIKVNPMSIVEVGDKQIVIKRKSDSKESKSIHGLSRSLVANVVEGVSTGFQKSLEINGVGYRAEVKGQVLNLNLGLSHVVNFPLPEGIKVAVKEQTKLTISGSNKEMVGRVSSQIRSYRLPEPYKGKGIKYANEKIIRKVGKAAGGK